MINSRRFIFINLVIMFALLSTVSRLSVLYGSEIIAEDDVKSSEVTSEIDVGIGEDLNFDSMTQEEIASQLDPDESSQDFIIVDAAKFNQLRGEQLTVLYSGYDLSTFNSSIWGKFALYKVKGKYLYCIEPTMDIISMANNVSLSKSKFNTFSKATKSYIQKTMSAAVDKYNKTKNTDYLFAGQLLVWEHISTTNNDIANQWTIRKVDKFQAEIKEIESELKNWNKLPSFLSSDGSKPKVHTLKYDAKTDTFSVTLNDSNRVWDSKFANYSDFEGYKITNPSGSNNVKISISAEKLNKSKTKGYKWSSALVNTSEFYDANQDLVYVGAPDVNGYMAFKTEKKPQGGFRISKVNSDTNELLEGAEYSLYDNNGDFIQKYTTNKGGIIDTGLNLIPGSYSILETKAPKGYVIDNTKHNITISDGKINDRSNNPYKNTIIKGGFELNKVGVMPDGSYVPLENVEFTVTSTTDPKFKKVYITNKKGQIKTLANELDFGSYRIEETKAPNKYIGNFKQDFEISENQQIIKLNANKPIENSLYVNKVKVTKMGQSFDNNDLEEYPLADAKFKIYREASPANGEIDEEDLLIEEITTDEDGVALSGYMSSGKYLVQESLAPRGYIQTEEVYSFTVNKNSGEPNQSTIELEPITNEVIMGRAQLTKVGVRACDDEVCQTPLDKVSFAIYDSQQIVGEDEPIEIIETDEEGFAETSDLKFGIYYAKEIENEHPNYILSEDIYQFEISEADEVVEINDGYPIENQEKFGKISITKTGQSIENGNEEIMVLVDAEYTIYDAENQMVDTLVTDELGKAQSIELSFGKYTIKETKAPRGYALDSSVYTFEINEESYQEPQEFKFADQVITNEIHVSKIDTVTNNELEGAKLEVSDRERNEVVQSWVSTKTPYIFTLKTGKYEICETIAPAGYSRMLTCENFEVNQDGVVQKFTIENKPLSITATGNNLFSIIIKLTAVILGLLTIKFIYRFKQNTRI